MYRLGAHASDALRQAMLAADMAWIAVYTGMCTKCSQVRRASLALHGLTSKYNAVRSVTC